MHKFKRRIKLILLFMMIICCIIIQFGTNVNALSEKTRFVVLGGDSIGLRLETDVYVTGKFEVITETGKVKPWINGNISVDDIIVSLNNQSIKNINDLREVINNCEEGYVSIKVKRKEQVIESNILVVKNIKGENTIGLYVKDKVLGVGTLTYYDLKTKKFGALGHMAINQEIVSGKITDSKITGIIKGERGQPGEKEAVIGKDEIGTISINNRFGIFGTINNKTLDNKYNLIEIANISDVKLGKAYITTVINENIKETFEIEIIEVNNQFYEDIKGIKFKVTDEKLLSKTGGIIQGMSGSPIVQDGKLIGAVSHVLINDSTIGYGVFAQWMINYS